MNYKSIFAQLPVAIIIVTLSYASLTQAKRPGPGGDFIKSNYAEQMALLSTADLETAKTEAEKRVAPEPPLDYIEKFLVEHGYLVGKKYRAQVFAIDLELKKRAAPIH